MIITVNLYLVLLNWEFKNKTSSLYFIYSFVYFFSFFFSANYICISLIARSDKSRLFSFFDEWDMSTSFQTLHIYIHINITLYLFNVHIFPFFLFFWNIRQRQQISIFLFLFAYKRLTIYCNSFLEEQK